ncbi:gonadotropin-releasing hormone II receptor [Trichonephila clavipes]|nr:gonadotropin-releasing hormone II receptor [Trichonephila clavipes]
MSHTQISTPANMTLFAETILRDVSVRPNMNGNGTFPVIVNDVEEIGQPFSTAVLRRFPYCNSCGGQCARNICSINNPQIVEVVIHSLDRSKIKNS